MTKRQYPDPMREEEATEYLSEKSGVRFGPTALRGMRVRGRTGPAFVRFGDRRTRYWQADLDKWLAEWVKRVEPKGE